MNRFKNVPPLRALSIGIALGIAVLAAAIFFGSRQDLAHDPVYAGTYVSPPKFAPDAVLTDQNGRSAHLFEPDVPLTYLFFGYTHCPDECPLALASLGRAYRSLSEAQQARIRIVFVSVDPERDTPRVMKPYVDAFDAKMIGLTGSRAQLSPVWKDYGVTVDPASKEISHGDAIYVIDATQHAMLIYPPDVKVADLVQDAKRIVAP